MTPTATFQAVVITHGSTPFVVVPAAGVTALGLSARVTVDGTLNGVPFERRSIHPWGDAFFMEIPQRLCRQARVTVGQLVDVAVWVVADSLPIELAERLAADPVTRAAWEALTSSRQRQLANQIADARRPETRARRIDACVQSLLRTSARAADPAPVTNPGTHTSTVAIVINGHELPGRYHGQPDGTTMTNVHVGLQIGNEPYDPIPADSARARWRVEVRVVELDGGIDFRGPGVHGNRGDRFLYLTWGNLESDGSVTLFRRAKLMLNRVDAELVRQAVNRSALLTAAVSLTDSHGQPRCARVDPPAITWTVTSV